MKMGLLLVESFGSSLCGVLAQADTFSSALADALKGCIHSGAVCREVRTENDFTIHHLYTSHERGDATLNLTLPA